MGQARFKMIMGCNPMNNRLSLAVQEIAGIALIIVGVGLLVAVA